MTEKKKNVNGQHLRNLEITAFRFILKDLESKGLIFISNEMQEIENQVIEGSYLATGISKSGTTVFVKTTDFGKNFLLFIESSDWG